MTDYELSNFVYLFLWLPAEGSKCARGHILLLLIAFRLNEKEFLACCLLFMKWKEITSCIISLPIVRFFFFLTLLLWVGSSAAGAASGCSSTPHLYFVIYWCELGGWRGRGGTQRREKNPKQGSSRAEYGLVSVSPELCSATKPRLQVHYSLIGLWA